jgi:NAD(P)-dependent dehydrogenase (short-subunit alcohol dehydrogenase family)
MSSIDEDAPNLVRVGRDPGANAGSTRASVAIGFGSPSGDTGVTRLDLNDVLVRHPQTTFQMRSAGDAMRDIGIDGGDLVLVDRTIPPAHGHVVIAIVDEEFVCRQLCKQGDEVRELGGQSVALALDTGDNSDFPAFVDTLRQVLAEHWQRERIDHLVNNAGMGLRAPIESTSEDQFDQLMRVHLKGPFFLTQTLLPVLADGGSVLNVSSGLARFSLPGYAAYAMMKGGVEVMTRYMAKEFGARGIRVNTLAPGAIETDFGGAAVRDSAESNRFVASVTALGRAGVPGRHRRRYCRDCRAPGRRHTLNQRATHRGVGRHVRLTAAVTVRRFLVPASPGPRPSQANARQPGCRHRQPACCAPTLDSGFASTGYWMPVQYTDVREGSVAAQEGSPARRAPTP